MALRAWQLDTTHTTLGFTVRHMVVAKVHGRFTRFEGTRVVFGGWWPASRASRVARCWRAPQPRRGLMHLSCKKGREAHHDLRSSR